VRAWWLCGGRLQGGVAGHGRPASTDCWLLLLLLLPKDMNGFSFRNGWLLLLLLV
jgi:hypothetical protein